MDEWKYEDVPIHKFKVITEPNPVTGEIKQITEIMGQVQEEIIQTKSDQIRNALIDLGWTPPEGPERFPESKLPAGFDREKWLKEAEQCYFYGVKIFELPLYDLIACAAYYFVRSREYEERAQFLMDF